MKGSESRLQQRAAKFPVKPLVSRRGWKNIPGAGLGGGTGDGHGLRHKPGSVQRGQELGLGTVLGAAAAPLLSHWFLFSVPLLPLRCRAVAPRRWDGPRCWKRFQLLLDVMRAAALGSWANVAADDIGAFCESDQAACRCCSV